MIKFGIKNPERAIAFARGLKTLAFDFTLDMYVFMEMSKRVQFARVLNDGKTGKARIEDVGYGSLITSPGFFLRGVRMDSGTIRAVEQMYGMWKRKTKRVGEWAELAAYTLWDRHRKNYDYPKYPRLFRNGDMIRSGIRSGYGHFEMAWGQGFMFGAKNQVAADLHYGNGRIPARPFFYMDNRTMFHIMKGLHLRILSGFRIMRAKTLGGSI